jgi:hypothetical protein
MTKRNFSVLFTFVLAFAVSKSAAAPAPCQGADPKHALDGLRPFITAKEFVKPCSDQWCLWRSVVSRY